MSKSTPIQLPLPVEGATVEIPLTRGYATIIDAVDADLAAFKWCVILPGGSPYVIRNVRSVSGKKAQIYMHRIILERKIGRSLTDKECTDHINGNRLDNRRSNLRLASRTENMRNSSHRAHSKYRFKGIVKYLHGDKWGAYITINKEKVWIGTYDTDVEAAIAYNGAASHYFGEFAKLNTIPEETL